MPETAKSNSPYLDNTDWNLANLPPEKHEDVAKFAWELFETAWRERDRQGLQDRWRANDKRAPHRARVSTAARRTSRICHC